MRAPGIFIWILIVCAACSSVSIMSDFDHSVDFNYYKTFALCDSGTPQPGDPVLHPLNQDRLKEAVAKQMETRGYRQSSNPDLRVNIYVKVKPNRGTTEYISSPDFPYLGHYISYGFNDYYDYWAPGWSYREGPLREHKEGTLIIDIVDVVREQVVWQGIAVNGLNRIPTGQSEKINNIVKNVFDEYPFVAGINHFMITRK